MSSIRSGARSGPVRDGRCTGVYRRRRPERTVLYQVVQCHLESWLAQYREAEPGHDPIPWYVERDFGNCSCVAYMDSPTLSTES